ncbi:MAG: 2,4-dihydroxyhept-2-ene-1,7-dioic acid aldolase [Herpetosiphonaceae bacterium]|nr:2,4-dihydroxyhept-2-ene-1,7-dioic acid aldolase [Herpetosiphonaceae bacterium]
MRPNTIRSIWEQDGCILNGWLHVPNGFTAEVMAHAGWDSLTIDMQHGVIDYGAAVGMLQAITTTSLIPLARVPWNEPGMIMKMLDAGCYGIICPMIDSRTACEAFVGACHYPPQGYRSFGPVRALLYAGQDYAAHADATVITMAMIETREAVKNLHDILSTPGLDAIYVGPADLSQSFGYEPRVDPVEPEITNVIEQITAAAREHGVIAGMHTGSVEYAQQMAAKGMQFLTISSDARLMAAAAAQATSAFHSVKSAQAATSGYRSKQWVVYAGVKAGNESSGEPCSGCERACNR